MLFSELFPQRKTSFVFPPSGIKSVCEDCRDGLHASMLKKGFSHVENVRDVSDRKDRFTWFNLRTTALIMGTSKAREECELIEQSLDEIELELEEREQKVRLKLEAMEKRQQEIREQQQKLAKSKQERTRRAEDFLSKLGIGAEDDGTPKKKQKREKRLTKAQKKRAMKKLNGSSAHPEGAGA